MSTLIKKIFLKKNNGNTTSLIIGQMFMMILIVWCLFNFRLEMLNTTFNYIDDSVTSSLLASALVNVEEYGKSNQLIIHNNDVYVDSTANSTYHGWEKFEADILLSELNYGSDITLTYDELDYKQTLNKSYRNTLTKSTKTTDVDSQASQTDWTYDYYLRQSLSAFLQTIQYNISNGHTGASEKIDIVNNVSALGSLASSSKLIIPKDVLGQSFLGNYITTDIEVTRFDIYNVYKANLAQRHVYHSEYMLYDGYKTPNNYATTLTWDTTNEPDEESEFINKYKPCQYVLKDGTVRTINSAPSTSDYATPLTENANYGKELEEYEKKLARWKKDLEIFKSDQPKYCYIDTQTSYQGEYDSSRVPYKYLYCDGSNFYNVPYTTNAKLLTTGDKAPIVGYATYSYRSAASPYGYVPGTTYEYKDTTETGVINSITISGGKMAGVKIENTSVYVELTFRIKTFPQMTGVGLNTQLLDKEVTVARLIDIELNTDTPIVHNN